jgi:hypothetical protein
VAVAEVDADGDPGRRVQAEHDRRAPRRPGRAALLAVLDDEPLRLQLGDDARHRRARQAGRSGEVAAARAPPPPQGVDDAQPVELAQRAEGAGRGHAP